jgi:diguanylate cyclase (GGDEF)-like protein
MQDGARRPITRDMAPQPLRLLILEDDPRIAARLGTDDRFSVVHCPTAATVEAALAAGAPDCALSHPGSLRDLRRIAPRLPVIAVTDATAEEPPDGAQDQVPADTVGGDRLARTVRDAIACKRHELTLAHDALHDPLTGLPNRTELRERISQALARLPRSGRTLALIQLRVHGHAPVGDALLEQVAERLAPLTRPADTLARLDDGFGILCDAMLPGAEPHATAGRIREALAAPFALGDSVHRVAISIGIGVALAGDTADELLSAAAAAPEPKRPVRVVVCDDEPAIRALMRHALEYDGEVLIVGEAEDGEGVVAIVAAVRPDVVLLDLSMPKVDGLQALPRILTAAPGVGVVVLSGRDAAGAAPQALALGAERFMAKPARIDEIRAAVLDVGGRTPLGR